jgi:isoquinoline 1-oxidoreductase subunit beta
MSMLRTPEDPRGSAARRGPDERSIVTPDDRLVDATRLSGDEPLVQVEYDFGLSRRSFVQLVGAGLLVAVEPGAVLAQQRGGRGEGQPRVISARIHIGADGAVTVMAGKVEGGQGSRAELAQSAAEELRVGVDRVRMVLADTELVPDDGITAGSRTTPSTVPAVRQAAAAAREVLVGLAGRRWGVEIDTLDAQDGHILHGSSGRTVGYGELVVSAEGSEGFSRAVPSDVTVTAVREWKVLGRSVPRPNGRDIVMGAHLFPSDIKRPGMLHGKILRPPAYGASLVSIDLAPGKAMDGVVVVQDGQFVGVAARTRFEAERALEAIKATAKWEEAGHLSSRELFKHLRQRAEGGVPVNPFSDELARASRVIRASYDVAYVQHAPLEPRIAVAEWTDGKLTVWTGTQNPFGHRGELARAFRVSDESVRVIVPDFGAGFGGKHTGETAVEAARLARGANRPVKLCWTREEEFTWAVFRPAAAIEIEASLDEAGRLTSWHFINVNSGGSAIETPYRIGKARGTFVRSDAPLRHGSYRALAATANNFAREGFMDELAAAAGVGPLEFRLAHLEHPRLRAVLEAAAERFEWSRRVTKRSPNIGVGLACGTEKGSYVAACVEVEVEPETERIRVRRVCEVFECGAVLNPANLKAQVEGAIIMGLGPALTEEMRFENGRILNASFRQYAVPRFHDVPELDVHLLDRPDLASAGGGETPIIAVAPAIANAVFHATGKRIRQMPIRLRNGSQG